MQVFQIYLLLQLTKCGHEVITGIQHNLDDSNKHIVFSCTETNSLNFKHSNNIRRAASVPTAGMALHFYFKQ